MEIVLEDIIEKGFKTGTVKFVCKDGDLFGIEAIICKRSDYLSAAFGHTMVETKNGAIKVDKNKAIVKKMLLYLHSDVMGPYVHGEVLELIDLAKIWLLTGPEKMFKDAILAYKDLNICLQLMVDAEAYVFDDVVKLLVPKIANMIIHAGVYGLAENGRKLLSEISSETLAKILSEIHGIRAETYKNIEEKKRKVETVRMNGLFSV